MKPNINLKYLFVLFFTTTVTSNAQNLDSLKARYNLLAPWVSSGILYDRNPQNTIWAGSIFNSVNYDGIADSLCSQAAFVELHETKYHEAFDTTLLKFNTAHLDRLINNALYETDVTGWSTHQFMSTPAPNNATLGFMDLDFHAISLMAYDSFWIPRDSAGNYFLQVQPYAIHDTLFWDTIHFSTHPNSIILIDTLLYPDSVFIAQNAFVPYRLLAFSALTEIVYSTETYDPTVNFNLGDSLWITNKGSISYEIDWDDGQGFVSFNPAIRKYSIQYSSYGPKTIRLKTPNETPSDLHPYLYARTSFTLARIMSANQEPVPFSTISGDTCARDMSAGMGKGVISIKLANGNTGLRKPLILVEGFDQGSPVSPENSAKTLGTGTLIGYGQYNWMSLSSGIVEDATNLLAFPILIDSLLNEGYDLILLDFESNRATIQKNANLLIHVIDYVNAQLIANESAEEIVVLGASMGGLIARYAIRKMELEGCCHNVRLYGTFSSPHRGANIPVGLQHFVKSFGYEFNLLNKGDKAKATYDFILNSPAARQMLIYHADPTSAAERATFQHELDSLGHPQYCRTVALTDGSQIGMGQINGQTFMAANQRLMFTDVKIWHPKRLVRDSEDPNIQALKDLQAGISTVIPPGEWTIINAEAFAIGHNPNGNSQTVMKSARNPSLNFNEFLAYMDYYERHGNEAKNSFKIQHFFKYQMYSVFIYARGLFIIAQTNLRLQSKFDSNEGANVLTSYRTINYPTLSYDNAPGDILETQHRINELSGNLAKYDFPHHNFVATVSALDVKTQNIYMNVQDSISIGISSFPFEEYWAEYDNTTDPHQSTNRAHVQIDLANIHWLERKKRETTPLFLSQQNGNELDEYFNFAATETPGADSTILPSDVFLPSVNIRLGGTLHVNRYDDITYQSSGLGTPAPYSNFTLKTAQSACTPPEVVVEGEGAFYVGDTNYVNLGGGLQDNNKAVVFFRAGSKLELLGDGLLHISDNSRLVIEEGAELILHKDHIIHLDGKNAVLEIRGKLTLKSIALLKPTGNGYLRFAQPTNQTVASDFWEIETGAIIELNGSGKDDKKAEITGKLVLDSSLNFFKVLNCRLDIHPGKELHIKGRATIENARISKPIGATSRYGQVVVYGQPNLIIKNAEFLHGNHGLLALLPSSAHPLKVENADFKHCITGLRINGKNIELKTCRLDSNTVGLKIDAATASCDIRNSQFNRNSSLGIEFSGQSTAALYVHESQSRYNGTGILASGNCPVRLTCSSISNNTVGLDAFDVDVLLGGEARNNFTANLIGISISDVKHLILQDGYNNFATSTTYLFGAFADNANLIFDGTNYKLNVQNNCLPAAHGLVAVDLLTYSATPVLLHNWQPLSAFATLCPLVALASKDSMMLGNATTTLPIETNYQNGKLPLVVATAINDMTADLAGVANRDEEAVEKLGEIFSFVRANYAYRNDVSALETLLNVEEVDIMRFAINKALKALGNAYRYELIAPNRAVNETEVSEQLQIVQTELDNQLYYYDQNYDEKRWFYNKLAKAQAYRSGEHYDYALEQLAGISTENGKLAGIRDYWSCICEAEALFILEITDVTQYLEALDECVLNSPELRRRSPGLGIAVELFGQPTGQINYNLYPNPGKGMLTLTSNVSLNGITYRISDMQGTTQLSGRISSVNSNATLDVSSLSDGIYFLQLINDLSPPQAIKFVITR